MSHRGLLVSQIGYDADEPLRVIVRGTEADWLEGDVNVELYTGAGSERVATAKPEYWGELWGSHWWVAEFHDLPESYYQVHLDAPGFRWIEATEVGRDLLWDSTARWTGVDQLERRARLGKNGFGWQDAGALWQEANSHASMIVGLCEALRFEDDEDFKKQAIYGATYLARLQDIAAEKGWDDGRIVHDQLGHDEIVIVGDSAKAATTFAMVGELTGDAAWADRARRAAQAAIAMEPAGGYGFNPRAHGVDESFEPPKEHRTSDLHMVAWAWVHLNEPEQAAAIFRKTLDRQVTEKEAESGLWGHFRVYDSSSLTEKSWTHCLSNGEWGGDVGQSFPHWVMPMLEFRERWPGHELTPRIEEALRTYRDRFFVPACQLSPFRIIPLGHYGEHGWLHFAGLWHGMNAVYGLAAALAMEFDKWEPDDRLLPIARGNLQWIAGLNCGITKEGLSAMHLSSVNFPALDAEVDPPMALPVSMIHGIGHRTAGSWMNLIGSICNGFAVGDQFKFDVEPTRDADSHITFTDEDWITHGGGWLSGLSRVMARLQT